MTSFSHLKPLILEILRSPDIDLASISAKRVRKALLDKQPDLDIKEHKAEIDAIIIEAFHEISPPEEDGSTANSPAVNGTVPAPAIPAPAPPKRKRSSSPKEEEEEEDDDDEDEIPASSPAPAMAAKPKAVKAKAKMEALTDEELARQLHEQLNNPGRNTRGGTSYAPKARGGGSKSKKAKSSAYVDDSDIEGEDNEEVNGTSYRLPKKRIKKERDPNKPAKGGFHKMYLLTDELAAVVDLKEASRPQVVKLLWEYIRAHDLQDPKDRRNIICDDKLRALFGTARTNAFKMNKPLSKHFKALEVASADLVDSADDADDAEEEVKSEDDA